MQLQVKKVLKFNYKIVGSVPLILAFFGLVGLAACSSKKGCIDPGSISYDPNAKIDNGSCQYPDFTIKPSPYRRLEEKFDEISGIQYTDKRIWSITDVPGDNKVYSLNLISGDAKEQIKLDGTDAVNYEDIACSNEHFYIGDFGNNDGNRTDLCIYRIARPKDVLPSNVSFPDKISFYYPEQTDFRKNPSNNYDAEAMFYYAGKIFIFTKNRGDLKTALYEIPDQPGLHAAKLRGIFDTKGLITGADINEDGNKIVLCGINPVSNMTFLWIIKDFQDSKFFTGKKFRVDIGPVTEVGQIESVSFYDDNYVFLANEKYKSVKPTLYLLEIESVK
ncbi:MAG: hypothetical protein ACK40G_11935 [Cytophagaceae bacterium]